jgi:hypothetical protein
MGSYKSIFAFDLNYCDFYMSIRGKVPPVTGRGGPNDCETSRLPHFLDNRLTDGSEVFSLKRQPAFAPRNIPGTHFY